MQSKSTIEEIRARFDCDVERFSDLETGQKAIMDAPVLMESITAAAVAVCPNMKQVLDIGCGAGNNTLKLLHKKSPLECHLVDLSFPMLERAKERIEAMNSGPVQIYHGDIRSINLPENRFDVIFAAAVFHHLREDADWEAVFRKVFRVTAPGGSVWITDMVTHEHDAIHAQMWKRYGDYLVNLGGESVKELVFEVVEKEDSPRPVTYQMELLRRVGFSKVDILYKKGCFAAFGGVKE